MNKICTKCKIEKSNLDFSADKNTKSGFRSQCKECIKEKYLINREKILSKQKANYDSEKKKEYYNINIDVYSQRNKKYYKEKKEEILLSKRTSYNKELKLEYYKKNKGKMNKYSSNRISKKRKDDHIFRLKHNISSLIRNSIKKKGYGKSNRTEEILGCSLNDFLDYILNLFIDGMTFENHGEWHIDHIIPIVSAKTEEDVIKLNHYTNLQPLWAKDNLSKSGKIAN
jgi:hypothetical protein